MPIYDFKCGNCKNVYELIVHRESEIKCPECGAKNKQEKLVAAPAHFKGLPFGNTNQKGKMR